MFPPNTLGRHFPAEGTDDATVDCPCCSPRQLLVGDGANERGEMGINWPGERWRPKVLCQACNHRVSLAQQRRRRARADPTGPNGSGSLHRSPIEHA